MGTILNFINKRQKGKEKDREFCKKKFNSLSLVEKNAFEQIVERNNQSGYTYSILLAIPWSIFYIALFGLVTLFLFEVNILEQLRIVVSMIVKIWIPFILIGIIFDISAEINNHKLKRRLLGLK